MNTTIRLPVIRQIILKALAIAREKIPAPIHIAHQPAITKRTMIHNIAAIRQKSLGGTKPQGIIGLGELNLSIIEVEISLHEAISDMSQANATEHAERLKQRIIQLPLQLERLNAQKMLLPVQPNDQEPTRKLKW